MKSSIETDDERILKTGAYTDHYLIYNRKSTDDAANQKNSITYQKAENLRFAVRSGLRIAKLTLEGLCTDGIISERHSGFKEDVEFIVGDNNMVQYRIDRPKFHRLVQYLNHGYFKGVIFLCWDRASRNKGDDTLIRKLMKANVDIRFALAQYDKTSAGELHMDIDGMFAEHHSRVTREKVTITIRNARSRGLCTHKAPVGYLNTGSMEHKPLDPKRAPVVRQLFERAATGEWTLADLARWAIDQGFTMRPVRRRRTLAEMLAEEEDDVRLEVEKIEHLPTFNSIHKILTNPTYTGRLPDEHGTWKPSPIIEALVTDELFKKAQEALNGRRRSAHYVEYLDHPLRGLIRCGACGRLYTPYEQKGITYYGARCAKGCANTRKNVSFAYVAEKIGALIESLYLTDDEVAKLDASTTTDIALFDLKRQDRLEAGERRKKRIREDLHYLQGNRLPLLKSGVYTPESFVAEEDRLNAELHALNIEEEVSDVSMAETSRDVRAISELVKSRRIVYDVANPSEKDRIIRSLYSELTLVENTLQFKCGNGLAALERRFVASGDLVGWLSELSTVENIALIRASIRELSPGFNEIA